MCLWMMCSQKRLHDSTTNCDGLKLRKSCWDSGCLVINEMSTISASKSDVFCPLIPIPSAEVYFFSLSRDRCWIVFFLPLNSTYLIYTYIYINITCSRRRRQRSNSTSSQKSERSNCNSTSIHIRISFSGALWDVGVVQELQKEMEEEFPNCNSQVFFFNECWSKWVRREKKLMCFHGASFK